MSSRAKFDLMYTRKNAQVATELRCSEFVRTSLEQAVDKL